MNSLLHESNDYQTKGKHNKIFVCDELEGDYVDYDYYFVKSFYTEYLGQKWKYKVEYFLSDMEKNSHIE